MSTAGVLLNQPIVAPIRPSSPADTTTLTSTTSHGSDASPKVVDTSPHADHGFATRAIHAGQEPDSATGAVIPPIYMTSTYSQEWPAQLKAGYDYTRAGNPNFDRLETQIASIENARYATVFSAGLAAFTGLCASLRPGDRVVAIKSLYGGTYRLLTKVFQPMGIVLDLVAVGDWSTLAAKLPGAKLFLFETPTNPLLEVIDIQRVANMCRDAGVMSCCDNTFATPYLQSPLQWGIDVVIHSSTKYLGGHSDVVGGVLVTNDKAIKERSDFYRLAMGLNPSPFDCWLVSRSIKTLAARMDRHSATGQSLAEYLSKHPRVSRVHFPGLPSHPDHNVAVRQMPRGYSGMVSAEFNLSLEETKRLISSFKVITLAESLGGVESLVDHPASMTHASIPAEERRAMGLNDGLVRFSFGLEDAHDLMTDIEEALAKVLAARETSKDHTATDDKVC
ncbi:unnamed protein product [Vitrella brassicaformis CCMP3155]|uniref:cystathionine gamma-lyase n=2 Tax=Vitrella brassicaformis TaxID=1169539 RepID=A0A0G4ESC2_VITBC|nr:unnamed protein product [Vitrella brassicaformis CCMP3155]|eukprot:CEM01525.1 unnamed protein product [Vitrella brassicaformis CCMP3155]